MEALDRKCNLCMPEKMGFLAPKENSLRSFNHFGFDGPFYSRLPVGGTLAGHVPGASSMLCVRLVAARYMTDCQLIICKR